MNSFRIQHEAISPEVQARAKELFNAWAWALEPLKLTMDGPVLRSLKFQALAQAKREAACQKPAEPR